MVNVADIHLPRATLGPWTCAWHLRQRFEITLDQQLGVDAPMRAVADRAALPHRRMLKDKGPGLLPVALRAGFTPTRHGQPAGRFEDVAAMRVMALHAIHLFLRHRVVLGKLELRLFLAVALVTSRRVFAGIDDEFASPATARHMQARGSVARLATRLPQPRECLPGGFGRGRWWERCG